MNKRWKNRPPGSNWGEFGPDDQRGRMNLVTREKVLQGIAEVLVILREPLDGKSGRPPSRAVLRGRFGAGGRQFRIQLGAP